MMAVALIALSASGDEYRIFTDPQGRAIEAKMLQFNAAKRKIKLERKDGKTFWVSPDVFSGEDAVYIQEWIAAEQILSEKNLRISFRKKTDSADEKDDSGKLTFDGKALHYEVTVENRLALPIESLRIEYLYFIKNRTKTNDKNGPWTIRRVSGRLDIKKMEASGSRVVLTEPVTYGDKISHIAVYDRYTGSLSGYDEKTMSEEDIEGIWLRIYGPEVNGEAVFRDVCYPEELQDKVSWNG
jgi:hypothetical protein